MVLLSPAGGRVLFLRREGNWCYFVCSATGVRAGRSREEGMAKAKAEADPSRTKDDGADRAPTVIKKYANRRLYDTERSTYVTLVDLAAMTRAGRHFVVKDARTDEDITAAIFVQIVLESENRGEHLLPIGFLRRLVALYGGSMQWVVPSYLESSMEIFSRNQELLRQQMNTAFSNPAAAGLEQLKEVNRALFEPALELLAPYAAGGAEASAESGGSAPAGDHAAEESAEDQIQELRSQVDELKTQVAKLAGKS